MTFTIIYISTIGITGVILYLLSKIIRSLGYLCMTKIHSAKEEFVNFWQVEYSSNDL
jgi:hypothetical protein